MKNLKIYPEGIKGFQVLMQASSLETKEVAQNLLRILALLPTEDRKIFFLSVIEGHSDIEISVQCRCSFLQVRSRLNNCIQHIQKNVNNYQMMMSPVGKSMEKKITKSKSYD